MATVRLKPCHKTAVALAKMSADLRKEILGTVSVTLLDLQTLGRGRSVLKSLLPHYPGRVRMKLVAGRPNILKTVERLSPFETDKQVKERVTKRRKAVGV